MGDPVQYMAALERGNQIRLDRADLKREIKQGTVKVIDILSHTPEFALTMTIHNLLCAQSGWGHTRVTTFLARNGILERKQLIDLTERQRKLLINKLI